MNKVREKLKTLPESPGVYLMKDKSNNIIYVGKAKNLKKRVRQYFYKSANHPPKIEEMMVIVDDFDFIITDLEIDAFILENRLIKKYMPMYNAQMKNYENYNYIKISKDKFPRLIVTKTTENDGSKYFGPFSKNYYTHEMLEMIRDIFPIQRCNKSFNGTIETPCLNYHINKCIGPCTGKVTEEEYNDLINQVAHFLAGNDSILVEDLEDEMAIAVENLDFERAAGFRDRLRLINSLVYKQKAVSLALEKDIIIAVIKDEDKGLWLYCIRKGKYIGKEFYENSDIDKIKLMDIVMRLHDIGYEYNGYEKGDIIQKEDIDEAHILKRWLLRKDVAFVSVDLRGRDKESIDSVVEEIIRQMQEL